jgi:monofunctional glycosyltransferase
MDRTEDTCDGVTDPQTVRTMPGKAGVPVIAPLPLQTAEADMRAPPLPSPASENILHTAVELPRPYAVASVQHTLPPAAEGLTAAPPDVPSPLTATRPAATFAPPPRPMIPLAYRTLLAQTSARTQPPAQLQAKTLPLPPRPLRPQDYPAWVSAVANEVLARSDNAPIAPVEIAAPPPKLPPPLAAAPPPVAAPAPVLRVDTARRPAELAPPRESSAKQLALKCAKIAAYAVAGYMAFVLALIIVYRFVNPPTSSLMLQQRIAGKDIMQDWVSMDAISPQIVRAVLLSEDGRFCQHHGIDLLEMQAAIERAQDGIPRGASTISMQVIKNLFLWPSKSFVRKAIEIPLTLAMELLWPKRRIMEVYLNIAEWGPGIFGVESASRFHFDKAASRLNEREAAQLAVALPNPYSRDPGDPGPKTRRLAGDVQDRMRGAYPSQTACVLTHRRGE